jgi:hypothetical protein
LQDQVLSQPLQCPAGFIAQAGDPTNTGKGGSQSTVLLTPVTKPNPRWSKTVVGVIAAPNSPAKNIRSEADHSVLQLLEKRNRTDNPSASSVSKAPC